MITCCVRSNVSDGVSFPPSATRDAWILPAFIKSRSDERKSQSAARGVVSAVRDLYRHDPDQSPANSTLLKSVLKASAKLAPIPKVRNPLTRQYLITLSLLITNGKQSAGSLRDWCMILLAYRGCMRGDELVHLRPSDVWINTCSKDDESSAHFPPALIGVSLLWVAVSSSKTRPQKQRPADDRVRDIVLIGPDETHELDPIVWYRRWLTIRNTRHAFLFHSFNGNNASALRVNSFTEAVKKMCERVHISELITGHSARAGGATDAI